MTTKRRIPLDQQPALGDWDGPIYGRLGVLAIEGDKVQCHCCGLYFVYLANHVWRTHHLYADEYRATLQRKPSS